MSVCPSLPLARAAGGGGGGKEGVCVPMDPRPPLVLQPYSHTWVYQKTPLPRGHLFAGGTSLFSTQHTSTRGRFRRFLRGASPQPHPKHVGGTSRTVPLLPGDTRVPGALLLSLREVSEAGENP